MILSLQEMIDKNRNDLIEMYKKGLGLIESEDYKNADNISYLEQNGNGIFQGVQVLVKQIREQNEK